MPTITPEDLIIAKLFAWADCPDRLLDLDDLVSLCSAAINLDEDFLGERLDRYNLQIPPQLERLKSLGA